ncbi:MAG: HAMP domain-containing sensor histidine kinase [Bacteroidota bacterium]
MSSNNLSVKQRLKKISHNSTFRMVFLYFVLFILSSLILLSFIYWTTVGYIYKQLDHHIEYDMDRMQAIYNTRGIEHLIDAIETSLKQKNYESVYLLYNKNTKQILAGNLNKIPPLKSGWHIIDLSDLTDTPQQQNHSARTLVMPLPGNLIFMNGLDIESAHQQEHMIFNSLITGIAIILLLGTIGGFIISISTIKKINLINETINEISEGNLSLRIPTRGTDDDYDLLAKNINQMLNQIQKLMQGMQNISNNIAHDLRTPLTRLQGRLELIQQDSSHETSEGIQEALTETDNLLSTFNAMLRINKLESGAQKGHFTHVAIDDLLQDVIEFYEPLAEDRDISIKFDVKNNRNISADRDMLFQVFTNLFDNAIKYTPQQGSITVSAQLINTNDTPYLQIIIADTGVGIPENERKKVLEPFYRLEKHRDHQGNGLGLSLVAAIIKFHKGSIEFQDNNPGLSVSIYLPS